jgi:hypothetical protein
MRIEQLLHGYNNGHTLITGSIQLKSTKDTTNMALFSDWSEYRDPNERDSSYLTAYPLDESPYYVISKTWYATEMERPGSVWTHSLLIRFDELDINFDLRNLIHFFKRPQIGKYREYESCIVINEHQQSEVENVIIEFEAIQWLYIYTILLNQATPMVFAVEKSSHAYQMMCLTLMQFIPTDILWKLSFCSGSAVGRKLGGKKIILQFVTAGGVSLQNQFKNGTLISTNFDSGLQYVVNVFGAKSQEVSGLIRIFSLEIGESCNKFCAVANLLRLLDNAMSGKESTPSYEEVLGYLIINFPSADEGLTLKQNFLSKKISNIFCSEEDFFYMLCTLESENSFNFQSLKYQERLDSFVFNSRNAYINLLCRLSDSETLNTVGKAIISDSPAKLSSSEIVLIAENHWHFYLTLLMFDINLLNNSFWIDLPNSKFIQILSQFSDKLGSILRDWKPLFNRILQEEVNVNQQLATDLIDYTPNAVSMLMNYLSTNANHKVDVELLRICLSRIKEILQWIDSQNYLSANIITILVNYIHPSSADVRQSESEVWLKLLNADNDRMNIEYYMFLFTLSFNWMDENSIKYLRVSFYHLHERLRNSTLSSDMWMRLIPYTSELPFWQDWDKCKKLRKGIVKYLKVCGYPKSVLKDFTPDVDLNKELEKNW